MATTIEYAGIVMKDGNGNVGKINGLTENDKTTLQTALEDLSIAKTQAASAVKEAGIAESKITQIQDDVINGNIVPHLVNIDSSLTAIGSGSSSAFELNKATTSKAGVVTLATTDDVTAGTADKVVDAAVLKASIPSTDGFVTTDETAQTVAGEKTFSGTLAITGTGTTTAASSLDMHDYSDNIPNTSWVNDRLVRNWVNATDYYGTTYRLEGTAKMHNQIFRGTNLIGENAPFPSLAALLSGSMSQSTWENIYLGDYFVVTVNDQSVVCVVTSTWNPARVSGIGSLSLLILFPSSYQPAMNSTATTEGGFVNSTMCTTSLATLADFFSGAEGDPFYGYLASNTYYTLTAGINSSRANAMAPELTGASSYLATGSSAKSYKLMVPTETEILGHPVLSSSRYDMMDNGQLPLFRVMPFGEYISYLSRKSTGVYFHSYYWTRAIASSTDYVFLGTQQTNLDQEIAGHTNANSSGVGLMLTARISSYKDV